MDAIATGSVTEGEAERVSVWLPPDLYNIPPTHTHTHQITRVSEPSRRSLMPTAVTAHLGCPNFSKAYRNS